MTKKEIRKIYLEKRKQLTAAETAAMSKSIVDRFAEIPFPTVKTLFSYMPLVGHNEFDVRTCEHNLKSRIRRLVTAFPKLAKAGNEMEAIEAVGGFASILNQYGIAEPVDGRIVPPEEIDLVFVPLVAFDKKGYRVGYGKGYYDRFLSRCRKDCISIGFSFFEAISSPDDIHQFDVPLNFCISPLRVYEF